MTENDIAKIIVDCAYKVHTILGPGLLESVYEAVLAYELEKRGLHAIRQKPLAVVYENIRLEEGYRADLIVSNLVMVEIKSVEETAPVHKKQLLTYLRLADKRLGLLDQLREGQNKGRDHPNRERTSRIARCLMRRRKDRKDKENKHI